MVDFTDNVSLCSALELALDASAGDSAALFVGEELAAALALPAELSLRYEAKPDGGPLRGLLFAAESSVWIADAEEHTEVREDPHVRSSPRARTIIGAPVRGDDGSTLAALVVFAAEPRAEDPQVLARIERLARHIAGLVAREREYAALRMSEERLRQMAESIGEVFWMTDPVKSTIVYISPGYEKIWGRSVESLYADPMSFVAAIHPDDRQRVIESFPEQPEGTYDIEYRVIQPDGTVRWVHDRAFPVRDERGRVTRVTGIAADVTEHRTAEEERLRLQEEMLALQERILRELSLPLIPISADVLAVPLIGTFTQARLSSASEILLAGVTEHGARVVILDFTGTREIDAVGVDGLLRTTRALRLLGAQVVMTGIQPEIANTMTSLEVSLDDVTIYSTIQRAITATIKK